jgi:hypothetical protein
MNAQEETTVDLSDMSPIAVELLREFARTSGAKNLERVIEEVAFSVFELMKLIDTSRDPKIYPQDAVRVMDTCRAVLEKFKRFGEPVQLKKDMK